MLLIALCRTWFIDGIFRRFKMSSLNYAYDKAQNKAQNKAQKSQMQKWKRYLFCEYLVVYYF